MKLFVDHHRPDILAVTESWGRPALTDSFLTLDGYVLFRRDRDDRTGGGVFLLVRRELSPVAFLPPDDCAEPFQDSVWCSIKISSSRTLLIGCVYRSPNSSFANDARLETCFNFVHDLNFDYCLIAGDFNCPNVNWETFSSSSSSQFLVDFCLNSFLTQIVKQPTRGDNILDLIFVNDTSFVKTLSVDDEFPGSDHKSVSCSLLFHCDNDLPCQDEPTQRSSNFDFRRADWCLYRSRLQSCLSNVDFSTGCPDALWTGLKNCILRAASDSIPLRRKRRRYLGVPISGHVRRAFRKRKKVYRELKGSVSTISDALRARADDDLRTAVNASRESYEHKISVMCKSNPKLFWSYIRSSMGRKPIVSSVCRPDGTTTLTDRQAAATLNSFFASVFTDEVDDPPPLSARSSSTLDSFSITLDSVQRIVSKIPRWSSPGPDNIPNILLKEGGTQLLEVLVSFFQNLLDTGSVPSEWKLATVIPVFKNGSRSECANYRPISLTCSLCKVLERLIKDRILSHLLSNNLLRDSQYGFLPARSCCTALLSYLEKISALLDEGQCADAVYLDMSKAFDSVPHNRLIHKLQSFGVGGTILLWIQSFLSNRYQQVQVCDSLSDPLPVVSGVPQGSVLGPLLFTIYVDDVDDCLQYSHIYKFADDIKLLFCFSNSNPPTLLQDDLSRVISWCSTWMLKINIKKCACVHFGRNNPETVITIDDVPIPCRNELLDLGVMISNTLKPSAHCSRVVARANRMLGVIKLAFKFLDAPSLTQLYKSFVLPIFDYCSVVWSPYYVRDIEAVEKVQRRFTRILPVCRDLPYKDRLKYYNLSTLFTRRLKFDLTMVYKIVYQHLDVDPSVYFRLSGDSRIRGHHLKIFHPHCRLDVRKHWFSTRVIPLWNSLPSSLVCSPNVDVFKNRLSSFLEANGFL